MAVFSGGRSLEPDYFWNLLFPVLQKDYNALAHDYIWGIGFNSSICTDSKTKKKGGIVSRAVPEENNTPLDSPNYKERITTFNKVVFGDNCYSACKSIGVITIIPDLN